MAELVELDDPADPRLADYRDLRDVQLRHSVEAEHGLFLAEGEKVVRRAVAAGCEPRSFLMAPRWVAGLADVLDTSDAPCFVLPEPDLERIVGFHLHRGALASLHRPRPRDLDEVLAAARTVLVVEDVVDHANLGAMLRSAAALGVDAVLLSPRCADPLYRRSVKVAMGAVFSVPWVRLTEWHGALPAIAERGFTTIALTLAPDARELADVLAEHGPAARVALVVGSEGHGLTQRWQDDAAVRAGIAMSGGVDSLNVAAAAAVACYLAVRR